MRARHRVAEWRPSPAVERSHADAARREPAGARFGNLQVFANNRAGQDFWRSLGYAQDNVVSFGKGL